MAKRSAHYVNNKKFSAAVLDYVAKLKAAEEAGEPEPPMSDYIGECFMLICTGVSLKPNFIRYSIREEMVSKAIINCIQAIPNFSKNAKTRSGNPNAHSYFSTCAYWCMVRCIKDAAKDADRELQYVIESGVESFIDPGDEEGMKNVQGYIDGLRASAAEFSYEKSKNKTSHYGWSRPQAQDLDDENSPPE